MLSTCFKWMQRERSLVDWSKLSNWSSWHSISRFKPHVHYPPIYFIGPFKLSNINNSSKEKTPNLKQFFNLFVFLFLWWKSLKLLNGLKEKVAEFDLFKSLIPAGAADRGTSFRCNFSNAATSSLPVKYWTLCRIHPLVNRQLLKIQNRRFDLQSLSLIIEDQLLLILVAILHNFIFCPDPWSQSLIPILVSILGPFPWSRSSHSRTFSVVLVLNLILMKYHIWQTWGVCYGNEDIVQWPNRVTKWCRGACAALPAPWAAS